MYFRGVVSVTSQSVQARARLWSSHAALVTTLFEKDDPLRGVTATHADRDDAWRRSTVMDSSIAPKDGALEARQCAADEFQA